MSKHTKGQWVSHRIEETDEFAIFSLNTFIAQTENSMINEEPTKSEKQANANLIAAAPEMIRFITFIAEVNKGKYDESLSVRDNFHSRIAQRLLAKAEGK